jgi:hypothetical protein
MPTSQNEQELTSQAQVLSASNFISYDPCTWLSRLVLKMTPFEAVLTWIDLILFAAPLLPTFRGTL